MGLNDSYVAEEKVLSRYSYLRKLNKGSQWILIDCGSYKGNFAESVSRHLDLIQVVFVDINKDYNSLVKTKFPNSIVINRALAEKKETLYLIRHPKNPGQNYVSKSKKSKERIQSITLKEIFNLVKYENKKIFLKLDIEGNEIRVLKNLPPELLKKVSVISIEVTSKTTESNYIYILNEFIPQSFQFYRERRYGLVRIDRFNPHWTDNLLLFQNLILINVPKESKNWT